MKSPLLRRGRPASIKPSAPKRSAAACSATSRVPARLSLLALLALSACPGARDDAEALAMIEVRVDAEIADFDKVRFATTAGSHDRTVDTRERSFRLGYYHPATSAGVMVKAQALRGTCQVGEGSIMTPALRAGEETSVTGLLAIKSVKTASPGCASSPPRNDAGDGGGAIDAEVPDAASPIEVVPPPLTVSFSFAEKARDVARTVPIGLVFSAAVDPATVPGNIQLKDGETVIATELRVQEIGTSVEVVPKTTLPMLAELTVVVGAGVRGRSGERMSAPAMAKFTTADGKWGTPTELQRQSSPQSVLYRSAVGLAAAPNGHAIVVWERLISLLSTTYAYSAAVYANRFVPGPMGMWSGEEQIATSPAGPLLDLSAAIDPLGNAMVIYDRWTGNPNFGKAVLVRRRYVNSGEWYSEHLLDGGSAAAGANNPRIAMGPSGDVLTCWNRVDVQTDVERVGTARLSGSGWSQQFVDAPRGTPADYRVRMGTAITVDSGGNGFVTWTDNAVAGGGTHWTNRFAAKTGWGTPFKLSGTIAGPVSGVASIGVDGKGDAVAVFNQSNGGANLIYSAAYTAGNDTWAPPRELSAVEGTAPKIAMNVSGEGIVVWRNPIQLTARRYAGGAWAEPKSRITEKSYGPETFVAIDGRGLALIMWVAIDPRSDFNGGKSVYVARETRAGGISDPVVLNATPLGGSAALAVLPDGTAFAAWVEGTAPYRLMAARLQ